MCHRYLRGLAAVLAAGLAPTLALVLGLVVQGLVVPAPPAEAQQFDETGGDDVLVAVSDNFLPGSPSLDIAENGDLYAAVAATSGGSPEIRVYRSTDAGDSWTAWGTISLAVAPALAIDDPCLHIGEGTQNRVYLAYRYRGPADPQYSIVVAWSELNLAAAAWTQRVVLSQAGVDFQAPTLHSDEMSNAGYRLYLAAMGSGLDGGDVWFSRSTDFGNSWSDEYQIFSSTTNDQMFNPEIRYGRGGIVHCACYYNPTSTAANSMAVRYRRAGHYAASEAEWQPVVNLTSETDATDEFHVSVAASHVMDRVLVGHALRDAGGLFQPGQYRWSDDGGASWPAANRGATPDNQLPHLLAVDAHERIYAWGSIAGTDNFGYNYLRNDVTYWSPNWSHMDRAYAGVPNTRTGGQYFDFNVAEESRLGYLWMTCNPAGADSLFFDAAWRTDPGYPNMETGFPVGLSSGVVAPPALAELDGDPESEIVFGTADGNIHVFNHDGSVVPGWPVDIGSFHADATIAIGNITGNSDNEVVAGNSAGVVHAFTAAGSALPGWPVTPGPAAPAYLAIGAISTVARQVVTTCGNKVHLLNGDGSVAPNFPMQPNTPVSAPPALGDVDGDGDRDIVILQQNIMNVLTGQGTVQAVRGFGGEGKTFSNAPTLADLNMDGDLEIVAPTDQGDLYVMNPDGSDLPGGAWPYHDPAGGRLTSAALADMTWDGVPEIALNVEGPGEAMVRAFTAFGSELPGYPRATVPGWYLFGMPIVEFLDRRSPDVVVGSRDSYGYATSTIGVDLPGWPKGLSAQCNVSPASGDVDGDGRVEVVYTTFSPARLIVLDVGGGLSRPNEYATMWWPMYGYNPLRQGCLACDGDAVSGVAESAPPAGGVSFAPPSPNPSRAPVRLDFVLPEAAAVRLDIFDVTGRRVRRLAKQELPSGPHQATWDGAGDGGAPVATGTYYIRLTVNGRTAQRPVTRTVVLVR